MEAGAAMVVGKVAAMAAGLLVGGAIVERDGGGGRKSTGLTRCQKLPSSRPATVATGEFHLPGNYRSQHRAPGRCHLKD